MSTASYKPITVAMTGASGSRYGLRLIQELLQLDVPVYGIFSNAALQVMQMEVGLTLASSHENNIRKQQLLDYLKVNQAAPLTLFDSHDWLSPVASGTADNGAMVVCPCSMGMLSAMATGASNNLMERGADVCLKERRQLIIVPREAPFSTIHLENMLKLSTLGAVIMPASPGFYQGATTVDDLINFIVARLLQHLGFDFQHLLKSWGS